MARRIVTEPCNVPVNFRVTETMKRELDAAADEEHISSTEWVRKAIQEKLDRKMRIGSDIADNELRETIRSVVEEMLEEKKKAGER